MFLSASLPLQQVFLDPWITHLFQFHVLSPSLPPSASPSFWLSSSQRGLKNSASWRSGLDIQHHRIAHHSNSSSRASSALFWLPRKQRTYTVQTYKQAKYPLQLIKFWKRKRKNVCDLQSLAHWLSSSFQWGKHYFISVLCYIYVIWVVDIIQGAILSCPCEVWETRGRGRVFYIHALQTHTRRVWIFVCPFLFMLRCVAHPILFCFFGLTCALVMCSSAQCRWWLQFVNTTQLLPLPRRWQQLHFLARFGPCLRMFAVCPM